MTDIYEWLKEKAAIQLDKQTSKVEDGQWFDSLLGKLKNQLNDASLDDNTLNTSLEGIKTIEENKDLLVGLGSHAFNLLIFQLTSGKNQEAIDTYIRALSNADDLIALMNEGTDGVIKAKIELDLLHANAKKLVLNLLTTGVRYLLPFLLALI